MTDPASELSGRFGRYEIERLLGRGGMGSVYLARQADLDRRVVVKVISSTTRDPDAIERFQREARAAARVSSDRVVQVYDTGIEGGVPFMAMEYVDGCSAADLVKASGRLPWAEATQIVLAAAEGLAAAHAEGILHRDVKPANILVAKDGRVKVADFGLAKALSSSHESGLTATGLIVGTPEYMAPEQADGKELDARADVYALGVTWFELLTGERPFKAETPLKTLALVLSAPTPSPRELVPDLPLAVDRACARMIARSRDRRPASAAEVTDLIAGIVSRSASGRIPAPRMPDIVGDSATVVATRGPVAGADSSARTVASVSAKKTIGPAPPLSAPLKSSSAPREKPASIVPLALAVLVAASTLGFIAFRPKKGRDAERPQPPAAAPPAASDAPASDAPARDAPAAFDLGPAPDDRVARQASPDPGQRNATNEAFAAMEARERKAWDEFRALCASLQRATWSERVHGLERFIAEHRDTQAASQAKKKLPEVRRCADEEAARGATPRQQPPRSTKGGGR